MKWWEVSVSTPLSEAEAVSDLLMDLGANGVEMVDPEAFRRVLEDNRHLDYADEGFLDQYGSGAVVKAYFSDERSRITLEQAVLDGLNQRIVCAGDAIVALELRDDAEWKDVWKEHYKPFEVAPGFIVKPSWERYDPKGAETVIEMDPGMAFGTGTHETTRMCAEYAAEYVKPGFRVMDIGCGTAILSIVAAKRGASAVTAIDVDDAAVKTARGNIERNGEAERINVICGVLDDVKQELYDVLLVNIIADVIISLTQDFSRYLKPDGLLVTSGIIHDRLQDVMTACEENGFLPVAHQAQGEWNAVVFRCIGS